MTHLVEPAAGEATEDTRAGEAEEIVAAPIESPAPDPETFYLSMGPENESRIVAITWPSLELRPITSPPEGARDYGPVLSPDGHHLAFTRLTADTSTFRTWIHSLSAGTAERLTDVESNEWGPTFVCDDIVLIAKSRRSRSNPRGQRYVTTPRYGLDGERIATGGFARTVLSPGSVSRTGVFAYSSSSAGTTGPQTTRILRWPDHPFTGDPVWECTTPPFLAEDGTRGGRGATRQDSRGASVAPDGRHVAMIVNDESVFDSPRGPGALHIVDVSGPAPTGRTRWRAAYCTGFDPVIAGVRPPLRWSEDGSVLTFVRGDGEGQQAWIWSASTGAERLLDSPDWMLEATPNHDGSRVVLIAAEGSERPAVSTKVYVLDRSTGEVATLTSDVGIASGAAWEPQLGSVPCR